MATILTITANTLLDHVADVKLTPGAVNRVARIEPVAGGKGLNMGRVLARHGHRVIACGFAGGPTGAQLADLISADDLEPALVETAARTRVGFMAVDGERGGTTAVLEGGFAVTASEIGAFVQRVRTLLPQVDLVLIGGSVPDTSCRGLYRTLLDTCHHAGKTCWVDAYGPAMDEALDGVHPPALAKPNRQEYGERGAHIRWQACPELHLTDGGKEIRVRHPKGRWRVTPPTVREVNPVGSGDCYIAALAHARLSGLPMVEQLRYAAGAGAANAARADIARISPSDIATHAERVQVEAVQDEAEDVKPTSKRKGGA
jgi:tagatose 6-phosphate kinase